MSKVTLFVITQMIALAIKGVKGALRALRVILDLCDDGRLNQSRDLPQWASTVLDVVEALDAIKDELDFVQTGSSADYREAGDEVESSYENSHA